MKPLGLKDKESQTVTTVTFVDQEYTTRTFRIDWSDGYQYEEWSQLEEVRGYFVFPFTEDERYPNVVLHTVNRAGEMDVKYLSMPELSRLDWWLAMADQRFPVATPTPGRPVRRCLESLTTRQRRTVQRSRI